MREKLIDALLGAGIDPYRLLIAAVFEQARKDAGSANVYLSARARVFLAGDDALIWASLAGLELDPEALLSNHQPQSHHLGAKQHDITIFSHEPAGR